MPVRVMKLLGVEQLIATNAGGGLNKTFMVTNGRPGNFLVTNRRPGNINGNQAEVREYSCYLM
jgi:purine nucleoside phosphorylase